MQLEYDISKLFRTEYSKLIAVLCKTYSLAQIEIAEDIVSDTFLLATETWGLKGIPKSPKGWLYTVAKNKTKDYLRRHILFKTKVSSEILNSQSSDSLNFLNLSSKHIKDSQLKMLFTVCHPSLKKDVQIILALRILCGFGIDQISSALLKNKQTINKKLYRAKKQLKIQHIDLKKFKTSDLSQKLETVLSIIYLLFNEGYYSKTSDKKLHKEFCLEALRLALLLTNEKSTTTSEVFALISLMCFQSSRFEARFKDDSVFLYNDQDEKLWNKDLIKKGEYYLNKASKGKKISKYHLESAIAFWHTQKDSDEKWKNILQLYNHLLQIKYSSIIALNRTFALSKVKSINEALVEAKKINLNKDYLYHCLLANFYEESNINLSIKHLKIALTFKLIKRDRNLIEKRIKNLTKLGLEK